MMGRLTTHVLDTYHGGPAARFTIELWRLGADKERSRLATISTNDDGRANAPLLEGSALLAGEYELHFFVRDYFHARGVTAPFLNIVPVRFTIFDAAQHYHVPLLVSPWSYSTYRGS